MSSRWKVALGIAIAVLGFVALPSPSAAQSSEPFFNVFVEGTDPPKISKDLGSATAYFNITVRMSQPPNQLTEMFVHQITLTLTTVGPQDGWKVDPLTETSFSLATGKTKMVTVTSKVVLHNPPEDRIKLKLVAVNQPTFNGQQNPLTTALVAAMSQGDKEERIVTVSRELKGTEALVSFAKDNRWILFLGGGGLLVLAVLFTKRRKGGVTVSSQQPVLDVLPGRGASFPVLIANDSKRRQKLNLATSDVPPGWGAIVPVEHIELNGGESTTLWVTVKAPQTARQGESVKLNFIASGDDAAETAEQILEARVVEQYGAPASPEPPVDPEPMPVAAAPARRAPRRS